MFLIVEQHNVNCVYNFSGQSGMVLELDNSKGNGQDLRGMDVSWISRYREEEERYVCFFLLLSLFA